jgi:hypothetical protein
MKQSLVFPVMDQLEFDFGIVMMRYVHKTLQWLGSKDVFDWADELSEQLVNAIKAIHRENEFGNAHFVRNQIYVGINFGLGGLAADLKLNEEQINDLVRIGDPLYLALWTSFTDSLKTNLVQ